MTRLAQRWLWWLCSALLITGLATASLVSAATVSDEAEQKVSYRVVVDAPRALADVLRKTLDLVRWQDYEDMTAPVLERLIAEGVDQAKEAAAAQGYFSARVNIAVEKPEQSGAALTLRVTVLPGEPARVSAVRVSVTGPATEDAALGAPAIAKMHREWRLPVDARFTQESWDSAKSRALATLSASPYAGATIAHSEARVDPATDTAVLEVEIASGPAFHFGELLVEGLDKYDVSLVRNFSTITLGEPYSAEALDTFARRLLASRYFASVQARIIPDPAAADAATVRIGVIEAPRKRIETGLAYATDSGVHGDVRYTDVNLDGRGLQLELYSRVDRKIQNAGLDLRRPPSDSGFIDSFHSKVERTYISSLQTRTAVVGVRRQTVDERVRTGFGAAYYEDDQRPVNAPSHRSRALYTEIDRSWRNVDSLVLPTVGHVLNVEVGGAAPGLATEAFGRVVAQFEAWRPLSTNNELSLRAEAGAVLAKSRIGVPSALLFRTGGDTTVRGYAFESLGVKEGDATVGGRYYVAASAEAAHYFNDTLGAAVFVDAGNAADTPASLRPVVGYGVGLRVKSPVGRFRADVAYGQDTGKIRLHMSVGVVF